MDITEITVEYNDEDIELVTKSIVEGGDAIAIRCLRCNIEQLEVMREFADMIWDDYKIPVLIVDGQNLDIDYLSDEDLAKIGLQRIDES